MPEIVISPEHFNRVLKPIGYPLITDKDIEFTAESVKDLAIWPAMEEYYIWFPIKEITSQRVDTNFSIPFPDDATYGVIDARINVSGYTGISKTASPFQNELLYKHSTNGKYNTVYDYGFDEVRIAELMKVQANSNFQGTKRIDVNIANRTVEGFSNVGGELLITWAKYSTSFNDIPFKRVRDVIKLAQANLMEMVGMLRGQQNNNTNVEFDYEMFIDKAETYREEVLEKFKQFSKVAVLRG